MAFFGFSKNNRMSKKVKSFKCKIDYFPKYNIYLNVNHLDEGDYTLKIVYKNRVIKKTTFKK